MSGRRERFQTRKTLVSQNHFISKNKYDIAYITSQDKYLRAQFYL